MKIIHTEQDTSGYYLPKVEIKEYNVMIDGQKFFDQKVENDIRTHDNIRKITIGLGMIKQLVVY